MGESQHSTSEYTVETIASEIQRIVVERQELRVVGSPPEELERNRRQLAAAQSLFSRLLIARHLPQAQAS